MPDGENAEGVAPLEERVLIAMHVARDAERTAELLGREGISSGVCEDISALCREIERGAAAVLLTDQVILRDQTGELPRTLGSQPAWSAIPLVVLSHESGDEPPHEVGSLPNTTLVERPVRMRTLISVVHAALRHRRHQYEARAAEQALRESEARLARANAELEQRVAERTRDLEELSEARQELLRRLVTAQEEERGRIARDLHDDTGQQVTGLILGLNRLARSPAGTEPEVQETLRQLQELAQDVAQKSHRLAVTLRPTALDDVGLVEALKHYAEQWSHWTGTAVEMEAVGLEERLPPEVETTVYRVAQEALTNVFRHGSGVDGRSAVTRVSLLLQRRAADVLAVIEDNGAGFDVDAVYESPNGKRRLGLFGMQERARLVGGTMTIESAPGEGTTVYLRVPVKPAG